MWRASRARSQGGFGMAITATRPPRVGKWTEQALRVLRERYLTREGDSVQETPEEMCWRVAGAIAQGE
ncbi:MAG TPA: ribonucleotide reductase N-terminal alpha domain-containing protein, partial [Candidatus Eisenbacteria bacterium]|nr:ribonucleotide reductase N-terminal alpha domain-containing protein [Candidatus Eisenbacteria bacterium]